MTKAHILTIARYEVHIAGYDEKRCGLDLAPDGEWLTVQIQGRMPNSDPAPSIDEFRRQPGHSTWVFVRKAMEITTDWGTVRRLHRQG